MKVLKIFLFILISNGIQNLFGQEINSSTDEVLLTNWHLKSSVLERKNGEEISTGNYKNQDWYPVQVPTTVLNGLVKNGVYPDPRIDMNNYLIPDITDKFNEEHDLAKFSYLPNHVNPWKSPYWFRTEFEIPAADIDKQVWLNFDGINYRAELWLNGKMIADSSQMMGMFQRFKYNVTDIVKKKGTNFLAIKIYPVDHPGMPGTQKVVFGTNRQQAKDIFKDETLKISGGWDCALPVRDRNMGLYRKVYLSFTGNVDIINPYIVTDLPLPDTTSANLSITASLFNTSKEKQTGILVGKIDLLTQVDMGSYTKKLPGNMKSITFEKEIEIPANQTITINLSFKDFSQLTIKDTKLWWPLGYGEQYLHNLQLSFKQDGKITVEKNTMFGIREVSSKLIELNGNYGREFIVNGKRIFSRGGWLQPDMLLDMNKKRVYDEVRLLANANMNLVSSEDMPAPTEDLMDALDKYGIMWWDIFYQCFVIVPGTPSAYYPLDHFLAVKSRQDIILRYRNHPSLVAWCGANETLPGPDLYLALKDDLKNLDTTRTFLASTAIWWDWEKLTPYIKDDFPVGTTDNGAPDYTWYPIEYYFDMVNTVENQMFRNELGVPAIPTLSSLKKFIKNLGSNKSSEYYPLDSVWAEHGAWDGAGYAFRAYDKAIRDNYGFKTKSVADYANIAQMVNADSYRAMFEAANSRMWSITTGVMLWKLNASYPDVLWEIYDWYLNPNSAYYFTKKACEPLHIQMNANDYEVSVINTYDKSFDNFTVKASLYDFNLNKKWERSEKINLGNDRYQEVFNIPELSDLSPVYFIKLELVDERGKVLSDNFYWKSFKKSQDFSELLKLNEVKLDLTYKTEEKDSEYWVDVRIKNPTEKLSFLNRIKIVKKSNNEEILPTFWDDNFITLFPGEVRTIRAKFNKKDLGGGTFTVVADREK